MRENYNLLKLEYLFYFNTGNKLPRDTLFHALPPNGKWMYKSKFTRLNAARLKHKAKRVWITFIKSFAFGVCFQTCYIPTPTPIEQQLSPEKLLAPANQDGESQLSCAC